MLIESTIRLFLRPMLRRQAQQDLLGFVLADSFFHGTVQRQKDTNAT